jgi:hypothetical protein
MARTTSSLFRRRVMMGLSLPRLSPRRRMAARLWAEPTWGGWHGPRGAVFVTCVK